MLPGASFGRLTSFGGCHETVWRAYDFDLLVFAHPFSDLGELHSMKKTTIRVERLDPGAGWGLFIGSRQILKTQDKAMIDALVIEFLKTGRYTIA